jgi:hypothetical protein
VTIRFIWSHFMIDLETLSLPELRTLKALHWQFPEHYGRAVN